MRSRKNKSTEGSQKAQSSLQKNNDTSNSLLQLFSLDFYCLKIADTNSLCKFAADHPDIYTPSLSSGKTWPYKPSPHPKEHIIYKETIATEAFQRVSVFLKERRLVMTESQLNERLNAEVRRLTKERKREPDHYKKISAANRRNRAHAQYRARRNEQNQQLSPNESPDYSLPLKVAMEALNRLAIANGSPKSSSNRKN